MNFCHRLSAIVGTDGPQKPLEGASTQSVTSMDNPKPHIAAFLVTQTVNHLPEMEETWV